MAVFVIFGPASTRQACGATVINDRYLLTAAHCIHSFKDQLDQMKVAFGGVSILEMVSKNQVYEIQSFIVHPKYKHGADYHFHNDIALVKLKSPIADFGRKIVPVCIGGVDSSSVATAIGFGYNGDPYNGGQLMDKLQDANLNILSTSNCRFYWPFSFKADIQMCAGNSFVNSCTYDSGGPLINIVNGRDHQIGIVSHGGEDCGRISKSPTAFTRLSAYVDWIKRETQDDAKWCNTL